MAEAAEFVIGASASCTDGPCGTVSRVVIDPVAKAVTHLVVEPRHPRGLTRLVPVALVAGGPHQVELRCSLAEFERLDPAEEAHFVADPGGYSAYGPDEALTWPYYGLGGGMGVGTAADGPQIISSDAVPPGEVSVRRGDRVYAADGPIGHVQGLVIEPRKHHVTHVLLKEGHLWGRKDVAIPIGKVAGTDAGIQLTMTKEEVRDLPPVDIDRPPR